MFPHSPSYTTPARHSFATRSAAPATAANAVARCRAASSAARTAANHSLCSRTSRPAQTLPRHLDPDADPAVTSMASCIDSASRTSAPARGHLRDPLIDRGYGAGTSIEPTSRSVCHQADQVTNRSRRVGLQRSRARRLRPSPRSESPISNTTSTRPPPPRSLLRIDTVVVAAALVRPPLSATRSVTV